MTKPLRPKIVASVELLAKLVCVQRCLNLKNLGVTAVQAFQAGVYAASADGAISTPIAKSRSSYSEFEDDEIELSSLPSKLRLSMTLDSKQQRLLSYYQKKIHLLDEKGQPRRGAIAEGLRHGIEAGLPFLYALPHVGKPSEAEISELVEKIENSITP